MKRIEDIIKSLQALETEIESAVAKQEPAPTFFMLGDIRCPRCAGAVRGSDNYCHGCGQRLGEAQNANKETL